MLVAMNKNPFRYSRLSMIAAASDLGASSEPETAGSSEQNRPATPWLQSWVKGRPRHRRGSVRARTYVRIGPSDNQAGPDIESNTAAGLAVDGRGANRQTGQPAGGY